VEDVRVGKRVLLAHEARHGRHAPLPYDASAATRHLLRVDPAFEAIVDGRKSIDLYTGSA
jgi:hypothetical protein